MTLQDSPWKYYEANTRVSSYMFIVNQIYSESAADVCERFDMELLQLLGHLLPQHQSAGTKRRKKAKKVGKRHFSFKVSGFPRSLVLSWT